MSITRLEPLSDFDGMRANIRNNNKNKECLPSIFDGFDYRNVRCEMLAFYLKPEKVLWYYFNKEAIRRAEKKEDLKQRLIIQEAVKIYQKEHKLAFEVGPTESSTEILLALTKNFEDHRSDMINMIAERFIMLKDQSLKILIVEEKKWQEAENIRFGERNFFIECRDNIKMKVKKQARKFIEFIKKWFISGKSHKRINLKWKKKRKRVEIHEPNKKQKCE